MGLNFFSGRACRLRARFGDTELAVGSAFFVRKSGKAFLVTARHNFTGREWKTDRCLHRHGGLPNNVVVKIPIVENKTPGKFGYHERTLKWEIGCPKPFNEHTTPRGYYDIVGVGLSEEDERTLVGDWKARHNQTGDFRVGCVNETEDWFESIDREFAVARSAFAVGFPLGYAGGGENIPIWRGGTVATEPRKDFDDWPCFLVDMSGRNGLSGAPVLVDTTGGGDLRLAGLYSGRLSMPRKPTDEGHEHSGDSSTELGIVWKLSAVNQLLY